MNIRLYLLSFLMSIGISFSYAQSVAEAIAQAQDRTKARAQLSAEAILDEVDYLISESSSISEIKGVVKPSKQAIISSEIKAIITKIHFSIGEKFSKGDTLIEFDSSIYQSEYDAQFAILESQKLVYKNQEELLKLDGITQTELLLSELKKNELQALLQQDAFLLEQCIIKAPYDGIVIEKFVNEFELVTLDKQLLQIISSRNPQLELIVPSSWGATLKASKEFKFTVDETKRSYQVRTLRTSGIIDAVSKTIKVICEFNNPDDMLISGMTGTAYFNQDS